MHTNIRIQRYTYILAYMHEFIHKIQPPHIIPWTTDNGKMIFIHSFRIIFRLHHFKSTTTQRRSRTQKLTLCRSSHAEALQATVSEGLAQGSWRASRAGFEPMSFRSKGIDSTNVPPYLTNINR